MSLITKEEFFNSFKNQKYVEQLKKIPQNFKAEHNEEENLTEITIYGAIGSSWFSDSISANDIDRTLNAAGNNDVVINLNSPGGDAFDGISIYNRLKRHEGKITVHVDGWACSAASVIAMAADELYMGLGSMMMIHEASSIVLGSKSDMRKEAEVLDQLEEGIVDIYMTKATESREEVREKVDAETWFGAKKAIEIGFANETEESGGVDDEPTPSNVVLNSNQKKEILNELKSVLNTNNEPAGAPANRKPKRFL